jgi:tetratricopeptide (TPR) repeat protein
MIDLQLDTLEARGLIRIASYQPELEYLFRHALLQDTAYESLLKQERRALHQVVGRTLEELYPDRVGELAAVLAMHFEQAGETDKAIRYLMSAASFASARNAIVEAFDLFSRAAALLPPKPETGADPYQRQRVEIPLGRARSGFSFLSEDDVLATLDPIVGDAHAIGDLRLEAELHLTIALLRQFKRESPDTSPLLQASLTRVAEIAKELDDPLIAALPDSIVGLYRVFTGDIRNGVEILERTAPQLALKHDFVGSSFALVALSIGYARLGEFEKAANAANEASALAEKGDIIARLDSLIAQSTVRSIRGDLDGAVPLARQCTSMAEESGAIACVVASNFLLGDAFMRQGNFEEARLALERGEEVSKAIRDRQFRPSIVAYMRANAASVGEFGPDVGSFDEALALATDTRDRFGQANVHWKRAETEVRRQPSDRDLDQVWSDFALATAGFESMGTRPYLARSLRDWGNALRACGDPDAGDDKLKRSLQLFTELGIKGEAAEVTAELAGAPGGLALS